MAFAAVGPGSVLELGALNVDHFRTDADSAAVGVDTPGQRKGVFRAAGVVGLVAEIFDFQTVEIFAGHHIYHSGHGVGTVDGRGRVEQVVVLLDEIARDQVEVGGKGRALYAARRKPAPVEQGQRSVGAQTAQVDGGSGGSVVQNEALERQVDLLALRGRRGLQNVGGVDQARLLRELHADDLQGRDTAVGVALDPRARDHNFFELSGALGGRFCQGIQVAPRFERC